MPELSPKDLQDSLKKGAPAGAYFFCGEEEYFKSRVAAQIRSALFPDPSMLPFGRVKISGEGTAAAGGFSTEDGISSGGLGELQSELLALPMFGGQKLIELHSVNYDKLKAGELEELLYLLSLADENTTLLFYARDGEFSPGELPKKPSALYKKLAFSPDLKVVCFERETPGRLTAWVQKHFAASGVFCDLPTAKAFIDYCSPDMFTLASEAEKLSCYLLENRKSTVTAEDIRLVCRAVRFDGRFAFTNAILAGNTPEAMRLLGVMKRQSKREERVELLLLADIADCVAGMYNCRTLFDAGMKKQEISDATGIHEYKVGLLLNAAARYRPAVLRKALAACGQVDLRLKGNSGDRFLPLELLLLRLAGAAGQPARR